MAFTEEFQRFRGTLGVGALLCQRGDAEAKGLVERANGYLETSFLPGRRFEDAGDFNRQLSGWLVKANNRVHATTKVRPSEAIWEERGSMLAFPPVLPETSRPFACACPATTTCASMPTTIRSTPASWADRSTCGSPSTRWWPTAMAPKLPATVAALGRNQSLLTAEHARILRAMRAEQAVVRALADAVEERDLSVYDRIAEVG
jgi:hypothetical protein